MNTHAPPGKETGALLHAPIIKLTTPHYHSQDSAQDCFGRWQEEAARLFREFWRSGNEKHLCAFVRHVAGMRKKAAQ